MHLIGRVPVERGDRFTPPASATLRGLLWSFELFRDWRDRNRLHSAALVWLLVQCQLTTRYRAA